MKHWRFAVLALLSSSPLAANAGPSVVKMHRESSGWVMRVDGNPFYIKGIACNDGMLEGVDYLELAAAAGANTVRIYGGVTQEYLDLAQRHGLKVNVGFWTNAIRAKSKESYRDAAHTAKLKAAAIAYVRRFKNHPAVLTWTLGNETFMFSQPDAEREAYGRFLENLVQAVHQEDPHHPVIYSSAYTNCLPYVKALVPSIDIIGINVTGGAGAAISWPKKNDFDRPVIITEFAPFGAWDQRKDPNQMPYDPFDHLKADNYQSSWRQIQSHPEACIGGFAFVLGAFRNQDSLTWFNMNYGGLRRAGYWTVRELYTGKKPENRPPKIIGIHVRPVSGLKRGERTEIQADVVDTEGDPLTYDYLVTNIANDPLIVEKATFFPPDAQAMEPGRASLRVPKKRGTYRIYVTVKDGQGNIAVADRTLRVD